ncbi:helix-turn-helix domain-containing protein [Mycetocola zhadangensis]|uniref:AraC family transcriptional regulator n=1 Tax=Mycetocola zhadangensis TaxID=1164595 RepID=A0A3L7J829_9MICO|nr:helix-turn-helix domain-containing protein [Mycetocola zhadangensis]RLQ84652.1 AraC family transcriptional regulator [Mycetocola zhadangensis]GGE95357.1 AraC family transcriptional regulator [Mycetocola zhadangensis]
MTEPADGRGVLYPTRLPSFSRRPAPPELQDRVRWFWIPQWQLAPGRTSRQNVLPFPASNLVVEESGVSLSGPTTGASYRDLRGSGWAAGALLRPGGIASLSTNPSGILNTQVPFDAPDLQRALCDVMSADDASGIEQAITEFTAWATENLEPPDESGLLANAMEDLIASDPSIVRVEQVASALHLSARGVQRLARRFVGVPPLAMIRRYRLQEAARKLRENPSLTIAQVAADLGYADHAHLTTDFTRVVGFTPTNYRRNSTPDV